jgi:mono/diheme cytochrome c family protein
MINVLSVLLMAALATLFFWMAARARRARRAWVRWTAGATAGLVALLMTAVTGVTLLGFYRLNVAPYRYIASDVRVQPSAEMLQRGERLARLCGDCHSSTRTSLLDGSEGDFLAAPDAPPLGALWGPNLTPGGPLKDWTDGEIIRAIREGVDREGRPLVIMPSSAFRYLSDEDTHAIVAYLRTMPAVDRPIPERNLNGFAAAMVGAGVFSTAAQPPLTAPVPSPVEGTPEKGEYLALTNGCIDCHGRSFDGTGTGIIPAGPNLRLIVPLWTETDFVSFFRTGKDPATGRPVDNAVMPWKIYGDNLTDQELEDMYTFLHSLSAQQAARP